VGVIIVLSTLYGVSTLLRYNQKVCK